MTVAWRKMNEEKKERFLACYLAALRQELEKLSSV